ncbi:MAG: hypothetical protein IJN80_02795 [Clostridia bacterium]|nr:hypothetical protein [Clostridia bacterium]
MQYTTFCAANSGKGFFSYFNTLLNEKDQKIYYIKGGPGSGKSTLMKRIAAMAEDAELILCSADPNSLDGVRLPKENAILIDATAPHSHEPKYLGVGGTIIDLGEGIIPQKLDKAKIISLSEEKSQIYQECYRILESAKNLHEGVFLPIRKQADMKKIIAFGDKFLKQNALWEKREGDTLADKRFFSAISPDGRITLSNLFSELGKNIVVLEDRFMQSHLLLDYIEKKLTSNGIYHINGYHPLFGDALLQHLIIPEVSLSIVSKDGIFPLEISEESVAKTINTQSYINKTFLHDHKNKLIFIKRLERELLNLACDKLMQARTIHMKIEAEYAKGCDFDATESLKTKLINNLFG